MACDAKSADADADGQAGEQRGKRKELLSVSMLYNFLRGDLGFLSVLRQLQGGTEMSEECGRQCLWSESIGQG